MSHKLNVVVAACENMGIGIEGRIPWRLKKDMAFFKTITMTTQEKGKKNAVIMGRKTWESIPAKFRPLQNRLNIILSSSLFQVPEGAILAPNFSEALKKAVKNDVEGIFIIGGSSVYKEAMTSSNPCRVYFTRLEESFECDAFFPLIDHNVFTKIDSTDNSSVPTGKFEENGISFSFEVYEKS